MKRKLLTLTLFLGIGMTALAQTNYKLLLWHPDGTKTGIELSEQPKVTFEDGKMMVTSSALKLEYNSKEVRRFTYEPSTGDDAGLIDGITSVKDGRMLFQGVTSADQVAVYSPNGIRIPVSVLTANGQCFLPLATLPSGVYVLNVNGKTSKFTKK
ncbi:MAG: T9SS type A sorting domain-containing protein [Prevotella sp.]|nr:T9SS type A sorting domain-containing protein [Prevotella sp.]MBQ6208997.1 T9SS type A sorting domain-containing protein [Prevotella sp.]